MTETAFLPLGSGLTVKSISSAITSSLETLPLPLRISTPEEIKENVRELEEDYKMAIKTYYKK
jgi:hypothetical protein